MRYTNMCQEAKIFTKSVPASEIWKWYFVTEIVRKDCSSDREELLKIEAEGREFANILRSLEQFVQTVKGQKNFW